jgi:hypothetical protein
MIVQGYFCFYIAQLCRDIIMKTIMDKSIRIIKVQKGFDKKTIHQSIFLRP